MIIDVYVYMVFSLVTIIYVEYFLELFSKHLKHGVYIYIYIHISGKQALFRGASIFWESSGSSPFFNIWVKGAFVGILSSEKPLVAPWGLCFPILSLIFYWSHTNLINLGDSWANPLDLSFGYFGCWVSCVNLALVFCCLIFPKD